jgi:hypothetical protein
MATSLQQNRVRLAHPHGIDHDLGSVRPNNDDDLKKPSGPTGSQVQGLVRIPTIVSCIKSVRHAVADVVIIEPVAGLMLPC